MAGVLAKRATQNCVTTSPTHQWTTSLVVTTAVRVRKGLACGSTRRQNRAELVHGDDDGLVEDGGGDDAVPDAALLVDVEDAGCFVVLPRNPRRLGSATLSTRSVLPDLRIDSRLPLLVLPTAVQPLPKPPPVVPRCLLRLLRTDDRLVRVRVPLPQRVVPPVGVGRRPLPL